MELQEKKEEVLKEILQTLDKAEMETLSTFSSSLNKDLQIAFFTGYLRGALRYLVSLKN